MNSAIERLRWGNIQVDDCEINYRKGDLGRKKKGQKGKGRQNKRETGRRKRKKKEKTKERNKDRKVKTVRETEKD